MKKKLSLNDLQVKSFVTKADEVKAKGGLEQFKQFTENVSDCGGVCSCFGTCDVFCNETIY